MSTRVVRNIRPDRELVAVINYVRAKALLEGKKPPSITKITKYIAKKIDKEKLWHDVFIKLR